jgi:hypothetical protein
MSEIDSHANAALSLLSVVKSPVPYVRFVRVPFVQPSNSFNLFALQRLPVCVTVNNETSFKGLENVLNYIAFNNDTFMELENLPVIKLR